MKSLYIKFQEWRYRRIFKSLFWFYAKKHKHASEAIANSLEAFEWLCEFEYKDLYRRFRD